MKDSEIAENVKCRKYKIQKIQSKEFKNSTTKKRKHKTNIQTYMKI